MPFERAFVPYRGYWSSPFCRWQGQLAGQHAMRAAAATTRLFLERRGLSAEVFDGIVLGITVPQKSFFYGAPWLAGMIGAESLSGQTVNQACATSTRAIANAAQEVELGQRSCLLTVTCDRTSNGPHLYYPDPSGPGGQGDAENPVMDNFGRDPWGGTSMLATAENVAAADGISREEQDEVVLLRDRQYRDSLADDRAFQRRFMVPVPIPGRKGQNTLVEADEGVFPSTREGLAALRPVQPDGTVTFGSQTHPADGNAGLIVATEEQAARLSADPKVHIRILGVGEARVGRSMMPRAVVPAAREALARAGVNIEDCAAIKTHNPFAVNDVLFSRQMGVPLDRFNRYGCSLVYGHPQGPTGMRGVVELIEELVERGGGLGLFTGCAAGDTSMALVLEVR